MKDTQSRAVPIASIMELIRPAVSAVIKMTADGQVGSHLPSSAALSADCSVKEARLRFMGRKSQGSQEHFVWIIVDKAEVERAYSRFQKLDGSVDEMSEMLMHKQPGIMARTNDRDFLVGYPESYYGVAPCDFAGNLVDHICQFLADNLRYLDSASLLIQIDTVAGGMPINLETDTDKGWNSLARQVEFIGG